MPNKERGEKMKKETLITSIIAVGLIVLLIILCNIMARDEEKHIERVSQECAEQGFGIKAQYTKEGDKYYVCNK